MRLLTVRVMVLMGLPMLRVQSSARCKLGQDAVHAGGVSALDASSRSRPRSLKGAERV